MSTLVATKNQKQCPRCNAMHFATKWDEVECGCGMRLCGNGNYQFVFDKATANNIVWYKRDGEYEAVYHDWAVGYRATKLGKLPYTITREQLDKYLVLV